MWCQSCGQDVPGVASDGGEYRCPRCRESLRSGDNRMRIGGGSHPHVEVDSKAAATGTENTDIKGISEDQIPPYDGWELEQRLAHIERMLVAEGHSHRVKGNSNQQTATTVRFDSSHAKLASPHERSRPDNHSRHGQLSSAVVWTALLIGVTTLACGGFLTGWSTFSGREELWSIGWPIGIIGCVSLLVALIVQIDRLLHDNRHTVARLNMVDSRLHRLTDVAHQLGSVHQHSPSDAFYSHFAGGANPQLLLSDLKSQLDLLAVKISQRESE